MKNFNLKAISKYVNTNSNIIFQYIYRIYYYIYINIYIYIYIYINSSYHEAKPPEHKLLKLLKYINVPVYNKFIINIDKII